MIARVPLRRGLLTGKLTPADQARFQDGDVRARNFAGDLFKKELDKVERLRFVVRGPVKSLAQAALAFCLADPAVHIVIPGARDGRQMRENAAAADLKLPPEDVEKVQRLWRNGFRD